MSRSRFPKARPGNRPRPAVRSVPTHVFMPGPHEDALRREICNRCDSVRSASVHRVPETPAAAAEIDQRRLGEGGDA